MTEIELSWEDGWRKIHSSDFMSKIIDLNGPEISKPTINESMEVHRIVYTLCGQCGSYFYSKKLFIKYNEIVIEIINKISSYLYYLLPVDDNYITQLDLWSKWYDNKIKFLLKVFMPLQNGIKMIFKNEITIRSWYGLNDDDDNSSNDNFLKDIAKNYFYDFILKPFHEKSYKETLTSFNSLKITNKFD
jgi:hypothetical protein